jgi:hypothetical protein
LVCREGHESKGAAERVKNVWRKTGKKSKNEKRIQLK